MASNPSQQLLDLLNDQLAMEFANHNQYLALAAWCEDRSLSGLSAFYRGQAFEEYKHAILIYSWLLDWDLPVEMKSIPASSVEADSAQRIAELALESEQTTTDAIHAIYDLAHEEKVWALKDAFSWFVNEQVEELAVAKENLDRARLSADSGGALLEFDREIGAKASASPPLPPGSSTPTGD
ncbi:MAG: ferritin [Phycisphaerales bacterium]|nr:ferritin [Phycisphaerales bacterium]